MSKPVGSAEFESLPLDFEGAAGRPVGDDASHDLLDEIGHFLRDHRLEVTLGNLTVAHEICSGSNPRLGRQIMHRQISREPVTQAWLDGITDDEPRAGENRQKLDRLLSKFDQSLRQFASDADETGCVTAAYQAGLAETATNVAASDPASFAGLTRIMSERAGVVAAHIQQLGTDAAVLRKRIGGVRGAADIDDLTGLTNRRAFEALLEREYGAAREAGESLCIALCDIDRFKAINDSHGRDTGDRVIQAISRALLRVAHEFCHVARYSGKEFVVLFRRASIHQALDTLDQVREGFARRNLVDRQSALPIGKVTFSGGIADVGACGDLANALELANAALYQAKEQGRNRILLAAGSA